MGRRAAQPRPDDDGLEAARTGTCRRRRPTRSTATATPARRSGSTAGWSGAWAQGGDGRMLTHYFERVAAARRAELDERLAALAGAVGETRYTVRFLGRVHAARRGGAGTRLLGARTVRRRRGPAARAAGGPPVGQPVQEPSFGLVARRGRPRPAPGGPASVSPTTLRRRSPASGCRATRPLPSRPSSRPTIVVRSTPRRSGRLLLGLGLPAVEEQQDRQLAGVDAGRGEVLDVQVLELEQGALEQVGEPRAQLRPELLLAVHRRQSTVG